MPSISIVNNTGGLRITRNIIAVLVAGILIGHLADVIAVPISNVSSSSTANVTGNTHLMTPSDMRPGTMPVSLKQLDNMEYYTFDGHYQLTNGEYLSQPVKDSLLDYCEVKRGTYISGVHEADHADHAFGDLNNDGVEDAVVVLREHNGGTGVDISLAVVMNEQGTLCNTATVYMGDRQEITSLTIGTGMIRVEGFTHRPTEGYMQPTLPAVWIYKVQGKTVELISGPKAKDLDEYGKRFEQMMNEK